MTAMSYLEQHSRNQNQKLNAEDAEINGEAAEVEWRKAHNNCFLCGLCGLCVRFLDSVPKLKRFGIGLTALLLTFAGA
jgi:hypothetical protein